MATQGNIYIKASSNPIPQIIVETDEQKAKWYRITNTGNTEFYFMFTPNSPAGNSTPVTLLPKRSRDIWAYKITVGVNHDIEAIGTYEVIWLAVDRELEKGCVGDVMTEPLKAFSWDVLSDKVAVKHMDKSAFLYRGTEIPKDIAYFFNLKK